MREGEASTTARVVAAARLRSPREPAEGGRPDDDERLARDVAGDLVDRPTMLERHLAARTAFVDRALVRALDRGVRQVVVAGAGYDGRALRYARPGMRWFELDHPDTQRDERERLARLGITAPDVTYLAADFRTRQRRRPRQPAGPDRLDRRAGSTCPGAPRPAARRRRGPGRADALLPLGRRSRRPAGTGRMAPGQRVRSGGAGAGLSARRPDRLTAGA